MSSGRFFCEVQKRCFIARLNVMKTIGTMITASRVCVQESQDISAETTADL